MYTTTAPDHVFLQTAELEVAWSSDHGGLTLLRRRNGPQVAGHGTALGGVAIALAGRWHDQARYLRHTVDERADGVTVIITLGVGPLLVQDRWWITGTLIQRRVVIQNVGEDEVQLTGVRVSIPHARIGVLESCRFSAPSTVIRPHVPLAVAARQRIDTHHADPEFTPHTRWGELFEEAPDQGPGLLVVHAPPTDDALLCWFFSRTESSRPLIDGNDQAVTLLHQIAVAGWLPMGARIEAGTPYILLTQAAWPTTLAAFQRIQSEFNALVVLPNVPGWVRDSPIYETHPAQWGGFRGLGDAAASLHALGIRVLYLMPVWEFDNRTGRMWDGNWQASGSPYAMRDFTAFDHTLGTAEDFRSMVDAAHAQGLKVLCDFVPQGCATDARYVSEHPDWFCRDEADNLVSSHGWTDTYSFDWANPAYQAFMLDWAMRLVREYGIDGYRIDAPHGKEPNWDRRIHYHASATSLGCLPMLDRMQHALKTHTADAVMLCELYGPLYVQQHDYSYDYLAHYAFFNTALGRITPAELGAWLHDHWAVLPPGAIRVAFSETHDTRDVNPLADGLRGSRLNRLVMGGLVLCNFLPMIWHGMEHHAADRLFLTQLLRVHRDYLALRHGALHFQAVQCPAPELFAAVRRYAHQCVLGLLNFSAHTRTFVITVATEQLGLHAESYHLVDMLDEQVVSEAGQTTWRRDELQQCSLTLTPWQIQLLDLRPGAAPATPTPPLPRDEVDEVIDAGRHRRQRQAAS